MRSRVMLVAAVLFSAALAPAWAADQSVPGNSAYYPNVYRPIGIDWTGFYTGLQLGGAFASASWTDPISGLSDDPKPAGVIGGAQIGVNWSSNGWLFGVEGDFTGTDISGSTTDARFFTHDVRTTWLSLITGRIGYAAGRYLLYAKGGAAFTNERNKVLTQPGFLADTGQTTQYGWTVGAGFEYAFDPNWSARLEYDFADFPSRNMVLVGCQPIAGGICGGPGSLPVSVNYTIQKLVAGINFRFN